MCTKLTLTSAFLAHSNERRSICDGGNVLFHLFKRDQYKATLLKCAAIVRHFTGEDVWARGNESRAIGSEGSVLLRSSAASLKAAYKNRLYRLLTVCLSPAPSWRWRLRGDRTRRSARPPAGTAERWDTASQNLPPVPTPDLGWTHPHLRRHNRSNISSSHIQLEHREPPRLSWRQMEIS